MKNRKNRPAQTRERNSELGNFRAFFFAFLEQVLEQQRNQEEKMATLSLLCRRGLIIPNKPSLYHLSAITRRSFATNANIMDVSGGNFDKQVLQSKVPVLVDFTAR